MKKVIYVSGQMTGIEELNFPEFNRVSNLLRKKEYEVINPAEFGVIDNWNWTDYMKKDIAELIKADIVAVLPNWQGSKGASLEVYIAKQLEIPVIDYEKLLT